SFTKTTIFIGFSSRLPRDTGPRRIDTRVARYVYIIIGITSRGGEFDLPTQFFPMRSLAPQADTTPLRSNPLDDHCVCHAAALTHCLESVTPPGRLEVPEERTEQPGP